MQAEVRANFLNKFAETRLFWVFLRWASTFGIGEVQVYRGTGVPRGVRRTTWERSLKVWELQISCFEEFLGGENVLGLVPASLPHTLGYPCTFYAPTSPPPMICWTAECAKIARFSAAAAAIFTAPQKFAIF